MWVRTWPRRPLAWDQPNSASCSNVKRIARSRPRDPGTPGATRSRRQGVSPPRRALAAYAEHSEPFGRDAAPARPLARCRRAQSRDRHLLAGARGGRGGRVCARRETTSGASGDAVAPLTRAQVSKPIAGAPAELAALHARVNELHGGGVKAFDAQLRALRGYPVVVNMWASWCDPCRRELPLLQREALARGARVAFLGVDVTDDADARRAGAASASRCRIPRSPTRGRTSPPAASAPASSRRPRSTTPAASSRSSSRASSPTQAQLSEAVDRYALGRE